MIALHGSPISNYYNKVKLALLEKGVEFKEVPTRTHSTEEAVLSISPLGKIPFIKTEQGGICESQPILDWLEATHPQPPLMPADSYAAAKVRELTTFIDWHLEIVARQLYSAAFFGGAALSETNSARIRKQLQENIAAFKRLAKFAPYVAGDTFTQADCSAFNHLPLVSMATKIVFGEDLLVAAGIDHKAYTRMVGERPSAQRVAADRKAVQSKS
jgi:glutathione S-transferase